ncbi:dnaJ homolog subfamily C member 22-like [Acanthaster planci]|uniref:DnaJ homolog subfamily C member 22 n=1 Tax=Acanthaster planci TaxID=133434 RepID=A0A8B7ZW47_ACAPL|nr:dnaJ homolog subfamily C member 22-like [Acanthaster planci]XP_022109619.1 dnaJ homolog subfamily C member 22-like [Acanthaster planci]XP_022109628.1 dnaJ homolog subfamily C member 22-like [Acanthaster planci]XP_022109636.1 dnaJ homolog subfamily C member 22-like [Acanthaster planci]XP_022109645.1 dnaJ homolog subfamily C member 22-like [Acanthaster planci]XP_022109649.1 dnaJ homolog subfamily C member 22-like [Acanthaster planci]
MAKNLFVAYVLWLLFGWLGLHHFYLGRDRQAFIWWSTWGGIFGLGWFRDIWRLPSYVDYANKEPYYMSCLTEMIQVRKSPPFNPVRFIGQVCFGTFMGFLSTVAVSDEYHSENPVLRCCLVPLAITIAVHTVGNIGWERTSFKWALLGACIPALWFPGNPHFLVYMALLSSILSQWDRRFQPTENVRQKGFCTRVLVLCLAGSLVISMWGSALYFNASVTTSDGETIKFRDAVDHFFNSPFWRDFKETVKQLFSEWQERGWENMWTRFVAALDPEGEQNAYEVLGLSKNATKEEITKRYRELAREYHPDKNRNGNQEEAAEKFMQIRAAYETLKKITERRSRAKKYYDSSD